MIGIERYKHLAKEALSSGDNILSENYLQQADHFRRIVEDKNKNKTELAEKTNEAEKKVADVRTDSANKDIKK